MFDDLRNQYKEIDECIFRFKMKMKDIIFLNFEVNLKLNFQVMNKRLIEIIYF